MKLKKHMYTVSLLGIFVNNIASAENFKHDLGQTEINKTPSRIVVLEYSFADALLSVGIKPIGIGQEASGSNLPYLEKQLKGVEIVGSPNQPSLEKILALKPDLIIADTDRHKNIYQQLSKIAPTVVYNSRLGSYSDILNQAQTIGRIVKREDLMNQRIKDHKNLLNRTKALNHNNTSTYVLLNSKAKNVNTFNDSSYIAGLISNIGRKNAFTGKNVNADISLEGLFKLNPEYIIILSNKKEDLETDAWQKDPLWQKLNAVKNNRVYHVNRNIWTKSRGLQSANIIFSDLINSGFINGDKPRDVR